MVFCGEDGVGGGRAGRGAGGEVLSADARGVLVEGGVRGRGGWVQGGRTVLHQGGRTLFFLSFSVGGGDAVRDGTRAIRKMKLRVREELWNTKFTYGG
jgi:hypothetical protein